MTADVVKFPGLSTIDLPPEQVIEMAREADLQSCVVLGFDQDGDIFFASSHADGGDVMWLMEMAKRMLIDISLGD